MTKFWKWRDMAPVTDEAPQLRELILDGEIASETWWGDEVTPQVFREELNAGSGDVTVWINSPGGDCVAASQIYAMLVNYPGRITVKIDGLAASAASVIAMAGDEVLMAPTALMMIHNPATLAWGDAAEMEKVIEMLDEVKESIINAYEMKTGRQRGMLARMMDEETWMNSTKAIEYGFADGLIEKADGRVVEPYAFSTRTQNRDLLKAVAKAVSIPENSGDKTEPEGKTADELARRLNLIKLNF